MIQSIWKLKEFFNFLAYYVRKVEVISEKIYKTKNASIINKQKVRTCFLKMTQFPLKKTSALYLRHYWHNCIPVMSLIKITAIYFVHITYFISVLFPVFLISVNSYNLYKYIWFFTSELKTSSNIVFAICLKFSVTISKNQI